MALNRIVAALYVIDILCCTVNDDDWGIGKENCKYYDKQLTFSIVRVISRLYFKPK